MRKIVVKKQRPKAFIGALVGAVGSVASGVIGGIQAKKAAKAQAAADLLASRKEEAGNLTQSYANSAQTDEEFKSRFREEFVLGGKKARVANVSSEDINNPVYSKKKPLPIKEQKKVYIDEPRQKGGKQFEKMGKVAYATARLVPGLTGTVTNIIDVINSKAEEEALRASDPRGVNTPIPFSVNDATDAVNLTRGVLGKVINTSTQHSTNYYPSKSNYA